MPSYLYEILICTAFRTICTFCVGNMKKTKIDTMPPVGGGHLGGGYPDFEEAGDTCLSVDLEHVSSYRIPSSRGSHVSTPAPYYYTSLEMIKEEQKVGLHRERKRNWKE